MPQATRNLILVVLVAVFAGAVALVWSQQSKPTRSAVTPRAAAQHDTTRTSIAALGRLRPQGGVIDVGGMAGERVDRLAVAEGDEVVAGQELAFLGSYPLRVAERELAEIQLAEARARSKADEVYGAALVTEAETGIAELKLADLDITALRAKIESLELSLRMAQRGMERLTGAGDVVSEQEQDHQKLVVEQAKAELTSAQAQLAKLEAARKTHEREAHARLETAKANQLRLRTSVQLDSLEKALAAATQKLEIAIVRAPRAGRILRILTSAGETVGPRPILQLGDVAHMYAVAEIYETDVRYVHPGQRGTVSSEALSKSLVGTVESVGTTVAKNEVISIDPTAAADARVVLAHLRLDDSGEAAKLVDLQVDVVIDTATEGNP